ncbi:MAG: hypothetical protein M0R17_01590 [Candidatus Omnitrophica bacterium]|nr:hypothetical protein [Candidatus Omnitrophota bacterium]
MMKSLLIINGEEHEVEFLQVSVRHREFQDYETVVSLEIGSIEPIKQQEEGLEAMGVGKPASMGIQKPADEVLDLKDVGIDSKLLEDLRKSSNVSVFNNIPDDKEINGTIWAIETMRYEINDNDPIGSAVRDLVHKELDIIQYNYGVTGLWIESGPSVKIVNNGFHLVEKVQRLKDKIDASSPPTAS